MTKNVMIIAMVCVALYLACSDKPNVPPLAEFNLYVQDGMADYDSIFITVDSIYLLEETGTGSFNEFLIHSEKDTFNIAQYRNGRMYAVSQTEQSPAEISGMELIFSQGRIVVNGQSQALIPGYFDDTVHTTVYGAFTIARGRLNDVIVDINLFESIAYEPQSGYYLFNPVLRIIDADSSGAIIGRTSPQAHIYLFENNTPDTLSFTVSEGDSLSFGFFGLDPGFYDVMCAPIRADTLVYDTLFNYNIPVVAAGEYDMSLLDLPLL